MGFKEDVWNTVKIISKGKVASYGDVAGAMGFPLRARQVGNALGALDEAMAKVVPWHRVVNAKGFLSIRGAFAAKDIQAAKLAAEGIVVDADYVIVDFAAARFAWPLRE